MFEYLKKYLCQAQNTPGNSFYPVKEDDINTCEKYLGCALPSQLRKFYEEIGYGFLTNPHEYREDYESYSTNRINPPSLMVEMLDHGQSSGLISEDAHELLQLGDIPFFEIGDSCRFLKMKALSDNPNAVWNINHYDPIKIADSLEEFIKNLYYKDPEYYGDIIEAHYAKVKH